MSAGCLFATKEAISYLLKIYNTTKNESMKMSAAVALSHSCKLNEELFQTFFDSIGFDHFCAVLKDGPERIQQAFITLLLYAVKNSYSVIQKLYLQNKDSLSMAIRKSLDNPNLVIKGKTLLTIGLLTQNNILWLQLLGGKDLCMHIDKATKDTYKYPKSCLLVLCDILEKYAAELLSLVTTDLTAKTSDKSEIGRASCRERG